MLTHEYLPYPGGVGRYCNSLAAAAVRLGHDITVVAPSYSAGAYEGIESDGIYVRRFPGINFDFRNMWRLVRFVKATMDAEKYDLIHCADWPMLLVLGAAVGATLPPSSIVSLHGTDIILLRKSLLARLFGSHRLLPQFKRYFCMSQFSSSILESQFPDIKARDVGITPLGVDRIWFQVPDLSSKQAFLSRINYREGDLIVLSVARLDMRKGHDLTIQALGRLPIERKLQLKYVCVGKEVDHAYRKKLERYASNNGVQLELTGVIPDEEVAAAYACSDVFALTARSIRGRVEGFGLVLLEAAAQGLPAVVTRVDAIPEVVVHGLTGWTCNESRLADITEAFARALQPGTRSEFAPACIAHAERFTWERCAEQTYGNCVIAPSLE